MPFGLNAVVNGRVLTAYGWNGLEVGDTGCSSGKKKMLLSIIVSIFKVWHVSLGGGRTKSRRCRQVLSVLLISSAGREQRPVWGLQTHLLCPHHQETGTTCRHPPPLNSASVVQLQEADTVNNEGKWLLFSCLTVTYNSHPLVLCVTGTQAEAWDERCPEVQLCWGLRLVVSGVPSLS